MLIKHFINWYLEGTQVDKMKDIRNRFIVFYLVFFFWVNDWWTDDDRRTLNTQDFIIKEIFNVVISNTRLFLFGMRCLKCTHIRSITSNQKRIHLMWSPWSAVSNFSKGRDIYNCAFFTFYKLLLLNVNYKNNSQLIIVETVDAYISDALFINRDSTHTLRNKWNKLNERITNRSMINFF